MFSQQFKRTLTRSIIPTSTRHNSAVSFPTTRQSNATQQLQLQRPLHKLDRQKTERQPIFSTRRHFTSETAPKSTSPQTTPHQPTRNTSTNPTNTTNTTNTTNSINTTNTTNTTNSTNPSVVFPNLTSGTTTTRQPVSQADALKVEIQTNATKASYLDRRDNIHSYEKGQFQVATGKKLEEKNINWLYYLISIGFASLGMSFVAVPLYQAFCQMTGSGGQIRRDQQIDELNRYMQRTHAMGDVTLRPIQVTFQATVDVNLDWSFYPCQKDITLRIGETALAFFRARNNGNKPVIGVSTYNVLPPQAGLYFNKIQCFCFDEQRLRAGEEIDMPVFFFLDPAMADDWRMDNVDQVTLCYTFFEVQEDEVDEAVKGLNEVRQLNNQRVAAAGYGTQQPATPDTNTTLQTFTIHVEVPSIKDSYPDSQEAMICPVIPPTATHNPSGISLIQSQQPRIVSDDEAKANQALVM